MALGEEVMDNWFCMTQSGRPAYVHQVPSRERYNHFFNLLKMINRDHQVAGRNWDRPVTLFLNGKEVELPKPIVDYAWNFCKTLNETVNLATRGVEKDYHVDVIGWPNGK